MVVTAVNAAPAKAMLKPPRPPCTMQNPCRVNRLLQRQHKTRHLVAATSTHLQPNPLRRLRRLRQKYLLPSQCPQWQRLVSHRHRWLLLQHNLHQWHQ